MVATKYKESKKLAVSLILFLISISYNSSFFSESGLIIKAIYASIIIVYTVCFGLSSRKKSKNNSLNALFIASIILFVASTLIQYQTAIYVINSYTAIFSISIFLMFYLLFFLISLHSFVKSRKVKLVLMLAMVLIVVIYFTHIAFTTDDEIAIGYYGAKSFLSGINPYSINVASLLNKIYLPSGITITSGNTVVGIVDYPALYFLINVPFILLFNSNINNLWQSMMQYEAMAFSIVFLLSVAALYKKGALNQNVIAYASFALFLVNLSAILNILMLALLIFVYTDFGEKYLWLPIGIMLSLQQQLWPISILFLAYSMNTKGLRKGATDVLGAMAIFFIINSYFIINGPVIYFGNIFTTLSSPLPSATAIIGHFLISNYSIPLSSFNIIFFATFAITLLLSLYINKKSVIPLLSIIPFLFLSHIIFIYFAMPIALFAFIIYKNQKEEQGMITKEVNGSRKFKYFFISIIAAIMIFIVIFIVYSHNLNQDSFNISIYGQSVTHKSGENYSYSSMLRYSGNNHTLSYAMFEINNGKNSYYVDLFSKNRDIYVVPVATTINSLPTDTSECAAVCPNPNGFYLSNGTYEMSANLSLNLSGSAYITPIIYSSNHYYQAKSFLIR